jgi:hypothetical protein
MVAAVAGVVFVPAMPWWLDIVATIFVLAAALRFTASYPEQARKRAETALGFV